MSELGPKEGGGGMYSNKMAVACSTIRTYDAQDRRSMD